MAILPKQLIAFFKVKNGTPSLGLTPTIRIWEVTPTTNTLVVGGGSPEVFMAEVGDGFYKYRFATYDSTLRYAFRIDGEGGTGAPNLGVGRYVPGTNDSFVDDIADGVWAQPTGSPAVQTYGDLLTLIGTSILGSPQATLTVSSIVNGVWSELVTGSPLPYPVGQAGGVLASIFDTQNSSPTLTLSDVRMAVWEAPSEQYGPGSPTTMGSQLNLTTANTISIEALVEEILDYDKNRTFLDKVAKTLTVYEDDLITPKRIFSLRDATGTPSITEIVERLPIGPGSPV